MNSIRTRQEPTVLVESPNPNQQQLDHHHYTKPKSMVTALQGSCHVVDKQFQSAVNRVCEVGSFNVSNEQMWHTCGHLLLPLVPKRTLIKVAFKSVQVIHCAQPQGPLQGAHDSLSSYMLLPQAKETPQKKSLLFIQCRFLSSRALDAWRSS